MKTIENIFFVIAVALVLWVGISWVEVAFFNTTEHAYASWNAFGMFVEYAKELHNL